MDTRRLTAIFGFSAAFLFLLTAITRSENRAVYIASAVVFLILALNAARKSGKGDDQ